MNSAKNADKTNVREKSFSNSKTLSQKSRSLAHNAIRRAKICLSPILCSVDSDSQDKIRLFLRNTGLTVLSALISLASLPGELFPFGISLVSAVCSKDAYFAFLGAGIACIGYGTQSLFMFLTYLMIFLIRRSVTRGKFSEKSSIRLLENVLAGTFCGIIRLSYGITPDSIISVIVLLGAGVCTGFLFCSFFSPQKQKMSQSAYSLCLLVISACITAALTRFCPFGVNVSFICACIITMYFSNTDGLVFGGASGLVCGIVCGDTVFSTALGISGIVCGIMMTSKIISSLAFTITALGLCVYLSDLTALQIYLPEILTAVVLYIPLLHFLSPSLCASHTLPQKQRTPMPFAKTEFTHVGECLSSLSNTFVKMSEKLKYPSLSETKDIIDDAFEKRCNSCSMNNTCFAKKQCDKKELYKKAFSTLKSSSLENDTLSEFLSGKCIHVSDICAHINKEYSHLAFNYLHSNRTHNIACQYSAMSHLFKSTETRQNDNNTRDSRIEKIISDCLSKLSVPFLAVYAFGKRTKDIEVHGICADKIPCTSEELCEYLSAKTGMLLSQPSFDITDRANIIMRLNRLGVISVEYAKAASPKDSNDENGDSSVFFQSDDGYFYSIISDGMGNGENAAMTSNLSCVFLEKMLSTGTSKKVTLELLNNLLLSKNDETFSTVDMLEIDTLNSNACFIKAGAAPSFVLRKEKLYKISSSTPPAGIIQSFSAESTSFPLEKGDIIIMVSDGIIETGDDALWLSEMIHIDTKESPALLCAQIIEKAKVKNLRQDDMSVNVIRII